MTLKEQLTAGIAAHGLWKGKLRAAIDSGVSDLHSAVIRDDHHCNFGKWLHGAYIEPKDKATKSYATCADLHRRFHLAAADIVALVEAGNKQKASEGLNGNGQFNSISSELTGAMMSWKSSLKD
jgi:hypothetical protein